MANRGFKHIDFLCDNPNEGGTISVVTDLDNPDWQEINLNISDCHEQITLDFYFGSEDGYNQRMDKLNKLREGLNILEEQMELHRKKMTKPTISGMLGCPKK